MYRQRNRLITRYRGLSTDDKPQNAEHGSTFHEMDTGTVYFFDRAGGQWHESPGDVKSEEKTVTGNPITVTDALAAKVKSLSVALEPIQNLNGQDAPYPPGGKGNLADFVSLNDTALTGTMTAKVNTDGSILINGTCGESASFIRGVFHCPDQTATYTWATFNLVTDSNLQFSVRTAKTSVEYPPAGGWATLNAVNKSMTFNIDSGKVAEFWQIQINPGITVNNVTVKPMIVAGSTAPTTYYPYSNICPISGRQSVTVTRAGKNLFDGSVIDGYFVNNSIRASGSRKTAYIPCKPNTTYVASKVKSLDNDRLAIGYTEELPVVGTAVYGIVNLTSGTTGSRVSVTKTTDANAKYLVVLYSWDTTVVQSDTDTLQIEEGSSATTYEAPQIQSVEIQLGQTVYSGTVDVVSGDMVVDRAAVDMGSLYWAYSSGANPYFSAAVTGMKVNPYTSANLYCSMYPTKPLPLGEFTLGIRYSGGAASVMVKDPGYSDAASFKTAMNGVQLCYELAQPITITLTPQQLKLLKGTNNVWSDGNNITMTYKAKKGT